MIVDFMAAGDQEGFNDLTKAAIPVTWGQAIEVPERTFDFIPLAAGDQAAKMFSPGAATSG